MTHRKNARRGGGRDPDQQPLDFVEPALLRERVWSTFTPPPALQERFRRLDISNVSSSYGQQKDMLENKLEKEGVDAFVATYSVLDRDGHPGAFHPREARASDSAT